ncbi:unnamed protein product [Amoebophrya sp. A25]|nr:unnamed protein product [Amoebophrya sp. A25]|eukprot:GSA25T00006125001.1
MSSARSSVTRLLENSAIHHANEISTVTVEPSVDDKDDSSFGPPRGVMEQVSRLRTRTTPRNDNETTWTGPPLQRGGQEQDKAQRNTHTSTQRQRSGCTPSRFERPRSKGSLPIAGCEQFVMMYNEFESDGGVDAVNTTRGGDRGSADAGGSTPVSHAEHYYPSEKFANADTILSTKMQQKQEESSLKLEVVEDAIDESSDTALGEHHNSGDSKLLGSAELKRTPSDQAFTTSLFTPDTEERAASKVGSAKLVSCVANSASSSLGEPGVERFPTAPVKEDDHRSKARADEEIIDKRGSDQDDARFMETPASWDGAHAHDAPTENTEGPAEEVVNTHVECASIEEISMVEDARDEDAHDDHREESESCQFIMPDVPCSHAFLGHVDHDQDNDKLRAAGDDAPVVVVQERKMEDNDLSSKAVVNPDELHDNYLESSPLRLLSDSCLSSPLLSPEHARAPGFSNHDIRASTEDGLAGRHSSEASNMRCGARCGYLADATPENSTNSIRHQANGRQLFSEQEVSMCGVDEAKGEERNRARDQHEDELNSLNINYCKEHNFMKKEALILMKDDSTKSLLNASVEAAVVAEHGEAARPIVRATLAALRELRSSLDAI